MALVTSSSNYDEIAIDSSNQYSYPVIDTNQSGFYDNTQEIISPEQGESFFGQDAQYQGIQAEYYDNGDGTITDLKTGLIWQQSVNEKISFSETFTNAETLSLGGFDDWRVPSIKELYSLMDFNGVTGMNEYDSIPYLNSEFFDFDYGDTSAGERFIDAQYWSSTEYVSTTMNNDPTVFGVNFADGRIKGYPKSDPFSGGDKLMFIRYVRGNTDYGMNDFVDNGDDTIFDQATGLTWMQYDSGTYENNLSGALNWEEALDWAENLDYAGYDDWRLPNAKELQSIVDYSRSLKTTNSAAIDPIFNCSTIIDEGGETNYPFYWTSTTHLDGQIQGSNAVYLAFGEALGFMENPLGEYALLDVHGAGAQRSDPKIGNSDDYPFGHGPQGDVIRINNFVRCVRGEVNDTYYTDVLTTEPEDEKASFMGFPLVYVLLIALFKIRFFQKRKKN